MKDERGKKTMTDIFISYSTFDREKATRLADRLRDAGLFLGLCLAE